MVFTNRGGSPFFKTQSQLDRHKMVWTGIDIHIYKMETQGKNPVFCPQRKAFPICVCMENSRENKLTSGNL